ncbi:MAG: hypothetical protein J4N95_03500 [Chloroflexi bacterium]|nr:hypothetical protein [Chloroflexota bacterium]MCI0890672.1 hypothetical protein [Chloroflexota bacterium]
MRTKEDREETASVRSALGGVVEQIRAERRWLNLLRLVVGATTISWVLFFVGLPWSVGGIEMSGSLRFVLFIFAIFGSGAYLIAWRPTLRHETSWEFIRVVFGATLLIRTLGQFKGRVAAECSRRKARGDDAFSLLTIQLADAGAGERDDDDRELQHSIPALVVRSIARAGDIVAEGPDNQIWVLALRASNDGRASMVQRIAEKLDEAAASFAEFKGARIGGATYPDDGLKPSDLFTAADADLQEAASVRAFEAAA